MIFGEKSEGQVDSSEGMESLEKENKIDRHVFSGWLSIRSLMKAVLAFFLLRGAKELLAPFIILKNLLSHSYQPMKLRGENNPEYIKSRKDQGS